MFWQVCCASDPSVICTGAARGLAVKAVWLHSVVSVWFSKTTWGEGGGASSWGPAPSRGVDNLPTQVQFGCTRSRQHSGLFVFVYCVQYVSNIRALLWETVMSAVFYGLFLPCFRAQFDRQVPGWCAKQQRLRIRRASGKSDSLDTKQLLPFTMQTGNEKSAQSYILYVFFSSSARTICPPEGSPGKIYAKKLCRTSSRENIILQVNPLVRTSGWSTCSTSGRTESLLFCL